MFPLPTDVGGISVRVNGTAAPILGVAAVNGQEQINFQLPYEVAGASNASVVVTVNGLSSPAVNVRSSTRNPRSLSSRAMDKTPRFGPQDSAL